MIRQWLTHVTMRLSKAREHRTPRVSPKITLGSERRCANAGSSAVANAHSSGDIVRKAVCFPQLCGEPKTVSCKERHKHCFPPAVLCQRSMGSVKGQDKEVPSAKCPTSLVSRSSQARATLPPPAQGDRGRPEQQPAQEGELQEKRNTLPV